MRAGESTYCLNKAGSSLIDKTSGADLGSSHRCMQTSAIADVFLCPAESRVRAREGKCGMGIVELLMVAVGLSMDAFAVAICKGLGMKRVNWKHAFVIALFFGGFQGLMPVIGWALGTSFAALIEPIDHWVAFVLLAFIGGKMLFDALRGDDEDGCAGCAGASGAQEERLDMRELVMMAIATSVDALAVGVTLAFLGLSVWGAALTIGVVTFVFSFAGVAIGNRFGARFERPATISGGIVLVLIGAKILLEHLGVIGT